MRVAKSATITPSVLTWAVNRSGFSREDLAGRLGIAPETFSQWESGKEVPSISELKKIADVLRRPKAVFFLAHPPTSDSVVPSFRGPIDAKRKTLRAEELRRLREANRLQKTLSWIRQELSDEGHGLPSVERKTSPSEAAALLRKRFGITTSDQISWASAFSAFKNWRTGLENLGCFVLVYPLGKDGIRGFSTWHDNAPVIAVNSHWRVEARIFTLFHEVGHLILKTNSACFGYVGQDEVSADARLERWCDRFAAQFLLPEQEFRRQYLAISSDFSDQSESRYLIAVKLANRFKVSLRATVLRMIGLQFADQSLYEAIPLAVDAKPEGGGGKGRVRAEAKEAELGPAIKELFVQGFKEHLLTRADVVSFLDVPADSF